MRFLWFSLWFAYWLKLRFFFVALGSRFCVSSVLCSGFRLCEFSLGLVLFRPRLFDVLHMCVGISCWCLPCRHRRLHTSCFTDLFRRFGVFSFLFASVFLLVASASSALRSTVRLRPFSRCLTGEGPNGSREVPCSTRRSLQSYTVYSFLLYFQSLPFWLESLKMFPTRPHLEVDFNL